MVKFRSPLIKLNSISMKQKLLVSYTFVVLLPVLLVGIILTNGMKNMALEQATKSATENVSNVEQGMKELFSLGNDVSNKIFFNNNLMYILGKHYDKTLDIYMDYQNNSVLEEDIALHPQEIRDIRLYSFNNTLLNNSRFIPVSDEMHNYPWFRRAVNNNGRISWNYNINEIKKHSYLSLTRLVKDVNGNALGILVLEVNDGYFDQLLQNQQFEVVVIDDENNIVAARDKKLVGQNSSVLQLGEYKNNDKIVYKGEPSILIERIIVPEYSKSSFKIISIFTASTFLDKVQGTVNLGLLIMGISLILSFGLILFFSNAMSKRLKQLSREIHVVTSGNLEASIAIQGNDEIGTLSQDLQYMIRSIKDLIHEVYEVNLQKNQLTIQQKEIKLRMLANQINPHFLFNVLETVRSKASCIGATEIVQIVKQLGKILRSNLEIESESIALSREIDLVRSYLEIQKYRFKGKIDYEINICGDIEGYRILPMIVQPIVENAVIHGIESKVQGGKVLITVRNTQEGLYITVADDGIGIEENRLRNVIQSLEKPENDSERGIGLRNVYQRIKLRYGEPYGFKIKSEPEGGTEIVLFLPGKGDKDDEITNCR